MMNYGEIVASSWKIIWKHKILFLFGLFYYCSSVLDGVGNDPHRYWTLLQGLQTLSEWNDDVAHGLFALLVIVLAVLWFVIPVFAYICIIRGVWQADEGAEHLSFSDLIGDARLYFSRVFFLNLLLFIPSIGVGIMLVVMNDTTGTLPAGERLMFILPIICVTLLFLAPVYVKVNLTEIAIIGENKSILDGLRRVWDFLRKEPVPLLIIWVTMTFVTLITTIPLEMVEIMLNEDIVSEISLILPMICSCIYWPVSIFYYIFITIFSSSLFTIVFRRLMQKELVYDTSVDIQNKQP